jgi:taurine dioxygenase
MADQSIEVRILTPAIGAEIFGVDLDGALSNQQFQEIRDALLRHVVIFFRDQKLTPEAHKAFGRRFGKLHIHPAAPSLDGHPEILVIKADENSKRVAGEVWHSDVSCDPEPPMGSILYMHQTPSNGGGDTMFANMYIAYETLSEPIKRLLEGLTAVHDGDYVFRGRYGYADKKGQGHPVSEHPVVRTHPETGRRALYVNRGFTTRVKELRDNESDALLRMLFDHAETPEFQCRFKWAPGSVAFWDNRAAMHHAMWDYHPLRRLAHRVTICGDEPTLRPQ